MADRQTDRQKATHWKSAVFEVVDENNWEKLDKMPEFVKEVYRQKEICPETQREHYQCHVVCHRQVTLKQMCDWIRKTKWMPVKGSEHILNSIKYCSKDESAVPGTFKVLQGPKYYQMYEILLVLARSIPHRAPSEMSVLQLVDRHEYKTVAAALVDEDMRWVDKLANPAIEKAWKYFKNTAMRIVEEESPLIIEGESITGVSGYSFLDI